MHKSAKLLLCAVLSAGVFAGCSSDKKADSTSSSISAAVQDNLVLGTKSDKSQKVTLTNETGYDIESVTLQPAEMSSNPVNLVPSKDVWKKDTKADLYIDSSNQNQSSLVFKVTAKDGDSTKEMEIASFPADRLGDDAVLKLENGQLILSWVKDGKAMSTLDSTSDKASSEQSNNDENEAAAAPEEETPAENEAPADDTPTVDEPAADEPTYTEPVYEEPVYNEPVYEEPVYEDPVDNTTPSDPGADMPSQDDENCINPGDVILNPNA